MDMGHKVPYSVSGRVMICTCTLMLVEQSLLQKHLYGILTSVSILIMVAFLQ